MNHLNFYLAMMPDIRWDLGENRSFFQVSLCDMWRVELKIHL